MVDVVDRITRSRMMAGIRGINTKPELALRHALHCLGLRYRLHAKDLPGRPDIVLPKHRAAIQVHGCFWHRHEHCAYATSPASNATFWKTKFRETIERDKRKLDALQQCGWRTAVVWECAIRKDGAAAIANKVSKWLLSQKSFEEIPKRRQSNRTRKAPERARTP
jgi:DNA mismatch endonuclease (patch repair protein)